jgi:protein phosphatase PTC7
MRRVCRSVATVPRPLCDHATKTSGHSVGPLARHRWLCTPVSKNRPLVPCRQFSSSSTSENTTRDVASKFMSASAYLPHPDKVATGGEDAHFMSACARVVAVADGVGGWRDMGIDSGLFSRELVRLAQSYVADSGNTEPYPALVYAFEHVEALGTSTICIVSLINGRLEACNLGDSGFLVCRKNGVGGVKASTGRFETVYRTSEQTHFFNCPYQIGTNSNDGPEHADLVEFAVHPGDIVVIATDGIFDNLFDADIEEQINNELGGKQYVNLTKDNMQNLANELAILGQLYGQDKTRHGPFSKSAKAYGYEFAGGKIDDVTVVVGLVL